LSFDSPLLASLREETRIDHDAIETLLCLAQPMPLERYAAIVGGFAAWLAIWEPRVEAALPVRLRPWFAPRRRAQFAHADAQWLRGEAGVAAAPLAGAAAQALPLGELPDLIGSIYVIEGSALGGQVLAAQLGGTLGLGPGRGSSYFHGFGAETGAMWREFRQMAVRELGTAAPAVERACTSARRTFRSLLETFQPLSDGARFAGAKPLAIEESPDARRGPRPARHGI